LDQALLGEFINSSAALVLEVSDIIPVAARPISLAYVNQGLCFVFGKFAALLSLDYISAGTRNL
jgi:hypothetical protein